MREVLLRELEKLKKELEHECGTQVGDTEYGLKLAIGLVDQKIKKIKDWSKYE